MIFQMKMNRTTFHYHDENDVYLFGILSIPILLNMLCVLFLRKVSLPKTKTGIISAIVNRCPDWENIRKTGERRVEAIQSALIKLGEFVFKSMLQEDFKEVFSKV